MFGSLKGLRCHEEGAEHAWAGTEEGAASVGTGGWSAGAVLAGRVEPQEGAG